MNTGRVSILRIKKDWTEKGFSCGLWKDPPGQEWKDKVHHRSTMIVVIEGTLELEMKGEKRRLKVGEEFFIPPMVEHNIRNVGNITCLWLYGIKDG